MPARTAIYEWILAPFRKKQVKATDSSYWAFISYSQKDRDYADWLEHGLETYRIPRRLRRVGPDGPVEKRLFPIYRDLDEQEAYGDLGAAIRKNLERSRFLIVICSPRAAKSDWVNEEVKFFQSLGRESHILCLIIDGEPHAGPGQEECFPVALRSEEPVAADIRKGRDSRRRALVKLVAGMLGVRFDALWRRELRRLIRRVLRNSIGSALILALMVGMFVAVADNGVAVPGGRTIRSVLDRYDASVFRPARSLASILNATEAAQQPIADRLVSEWRSGKWEYTTPGRVICPEKAISPWQSAQAAAAIMRMPNSKLNSVTDLLELLDIPFRGGFPITLNSKRLGWCVGDSDYPQEQPALWTLMSLEEALKRRDVFDAQIRNNLLPKLEIAQQVADAYYPVDDGGWNIVPNQIHPQEHAIGATALASAALLELHDAGLGWHGDRSRLETMIRAMMQWLTARFDSAASIPGWRVNLNATGSTAAGEVADGLTLQLFSQFLRAEERVGATVPPAILAAIPRHIERLIGRPVNYDNVRSSTGRYYTNTDGRPVIADIAETHLWYPWGIDVSARWLHRLESADAAPEQKVRARRALGYLIVDLGRVNFAEAANKTGAYTFVASETLYSLGTVTSIYGR